MNSEPPIAYRCATVSPAPVMDGRWSIGGVSAHNPRETAHGGGPAGLGRLAALLLVLSLAPMGRAQQATVLKGRNDVLVRGKAQYVFFYPGTGDSLRQRARVLIAPGDGGWRGAAITMAETMTSWGYDVFGLDTKQYLESFTGTTTLRETDVMDDVRQIADWLAPHPKQLVTLVGWSEGAGLMALAASSQRRQEKYKGLLTMGLSDSNVLGWTWKDDLTYLTRRPPNEPAFSVLSLVDRIAPLPLVMLQSTKDEYVSIEEAQRLYQRAREPKRIFMIDARNHRFDGNPGEFYERLREALEWINSLHR